MPSALTYRSLFAIREFRVLFFDRCVVVISVAASGLALATITYQQTRSAVLSGLAMFGGRWCPWSCRNCCSRRRTGSGPGPR